MREFLTGIISRLSEDFNPETLGETFAVILSNLIVGVLTFLAFYLVWVVLDKMTSLILKKTGLDETARAFVHTALKFIVLIIGAMQALAAIAATSIRPSSTLGPLNGPAHKKGRPNGRPFP